MEPFVGEIRAVGFNYAPRGWALCNGQLLSIAEHSTLFALLHDTYGGDGRTTFALPDLQGRSIVGFGQGPGLSNIGWGEKLGSERTALSLDNLPPHSSSVNLNVAIPATSNTENLTSSPGPTKHLGTAQAGGRDASLYSEAAADTSLAPFNVQASTNTVGSGIPFESRNPYLGMYYIIALTGIFPPHD